MVDLKNINKAQTYSTILTPYNVFHWACIRWHILYGLAFFSDRGQGDS